MATPSTILRWLRRRPLHERRIAGTALFVALAAAIVSLWVTSLSSLVAPLPAPLATGEAGETIAVPGEGSGELPAPPQKPLAELVTPLQALTAALAGTAARLREFAAAVTHVAQETGKAPLGQETAATGTEPVLGTLPRASAPEAPKPAVRVAAVTTGDLQSGPLPTRVVASLLAPPPAPPQAAAGALSAITERISAVWRYNIGEIRRALDDLFRSVNPVTTQPERRGI